MQLQEPEYVDAAVDKILAVAPDVCVLERGASLNAVERLQKSNVTLVYNIPMTDMSNLAINTGTKVRDIPRAACFHHSPVLCVVVLDSRKYS